eukprot:CAMPEP_0204288360 /NCGR_PEP_ID=MMETSP0468-20130131/56605_1 /ASSEMBLY_ACC=CAM_ASM_000383 /TAXON_ID=2969 /ORGANISM="Oxyrrhis marina" /LENGTH=113 /DNA_ID=CAMNT_0051266451 /DNA_START=102 /DNA_END=443 /DNA_ORIENTATION=+
MGPSSAVGVPSSSVPADSVEDPSKQLEEITHYRVNEFKIQQSLQKKSVKQGRQPELALQSQGQGSVSFPRLHLQLPPKSSYNPRHDSTGDPSKKGRLDPGSLQGQVHIQRFSP